MTTYYPVYLNLEHRSCVVIGARSYVYPKVQALLEAGASITVVAAEPCAEIERLAEAGELQLRKRDYRPGDLRGAFLAINTRRDLASVVAEEAEREKVLLNTLDVPEHCDWIAPAVMRRGPLCVAVSTSGVAPALAVRIRDQLAQRFGPEYAQFLELIAPLRRSLPQQIPEFERRRRLWYALVDSDILDLLRQGKEDEAKRRMEAIVQDARTENTWDRQAGGTDGKFRG